MPFGCRELEKALLWGLGEACSNHAVCFGWLVTPPNEKTRMWVRNKLGRDVKSVSPGPHFIIMAEGSRGGKCRDIDHRRGVVETKRHQKIIRAKRKAKARSSAVGTDIRISPTGRLRQETSA